ncbi:hypothetical protein [Marinobacter oulmenensis]|uniref:Tetratricopeptide (TPR) repeat protein n=1 Tax=Marinobacter oulmenensis TaxID=643747 RepID=A0A840U5X0_9GAMM|nr:hypothetical protein [Marinobacter oulmenensis]MBB5320529.1 tetratricopeptide (TPR) repeat protein [Marinobacter oulmenensis]
MKSKNSKKQAFKKCQNRFRGLVSDYRSHRFEMNRRFPKTLIFRNGLKELYLEAQAILQPSQYETFLSWLEVQINTSLKDFKRSPVGYEELNGVGNTVPLTSTKNQLLWLAARFNRQRSTLNYFLNLKSKVEQLALHGEYGGALEALDEIDLENGKSLWSIQLRIALLQQCEGLEEQKRFTAQVRKIYRQGLLNFVAFYTSVRNEEKTTYPKFVSEVSFRLSNHKKYSTAVKDFLNLLLTQQWPDQLERKVGALQVSESHSLIDAYETFIHFSQKITEDKVFSQGQAGEYSVVAHALTRLKGINDHRIVKLKLSAGQIERFDGLNLRQQGVLNYLVSGKVYDSFTETLQLLRDRAPLDSWLLIYCCYAHCFKTRVSPRLFNSIAGSIINSVSRVLAGEDIVEWLGSCQKLCANFSTLPSLNGLSKYLETLFGSSFSVYSTLAAISLDSQFTGPEDHLLRELSVTEQELSLKNTQGPTQSLWSTLCSGAAGTEELSTPQDCFFRSISHMRSRSFPTAIRLLKKAAKLDESEIFDLLIFDSLLTSYTELGEYSEIIDLVASFVAKYPQVHTILRKIEIVEQITWDDFKKLDDVSIRKAIGLHVSWALYERASDATRLRFVTGNLVRALGVKLPSDLVEYRNELPFNELIYLLKYICIPSILDGTQLFKSSREVMEERQAICAVLRELDPLRSSDYEEEIAIISNQLAHHDVQHIVDSTRIYVDTDALTRWALRELSEDIERCRDLALVDFDDQVNFDDLFDDLSHASQKLDESFKPETESELLLLKIFDRMREEFLNNPSFGLDFFLSKRVRHQSFIGFIRGPLEFSKLITNKDTKYGKYSHNDEWVNRLAPSTPESRNALLNSFSKFSERFDGILQNAKNNKFQINSQEKPEGLISLDISAHTIRLAQIIFRLDLSVEEFISTAIAVCWAQLEVSLSRARSYISSTLKSDVAQTFDELRTSIKRKAGGSDRALEADMQIGQKSNEVQRKLDETKKWFSHRDIEQYKRSFKLDHIVNIAIDSSLKCHRSFDPDIRANVEQGDMQMAASVLVFINDAISAGISNSEKHAGLKRPKIDIDVVPFPESKRLMVKVVTDSRPSNKDANLSRLREIEQLIADGNFHRRSRKEGGSGFIKLAAVVKQSDRGSIQFGFEKDGRFNLTVFYSLIFQKSGQSNEAETTI